MRTLKRYVQVVYIVLVWACMQTTIASAQTETPSQSGSIGDFVFAVEATGNVPLVNVPVTLWQNGVEIASMRTDVNGRYLFSDLPLGEYEVAVEIVADDIRESTDIAMCYEGATPAYVIDFGDDSWVTVELTEQNPDNDFVDFGYACLAHVFRLGGSIYSTHMDENIPLQNVRVLRLIDDVIVAETITDENGFYTFDTFLVSSAPEDHDTMSIEVDTSTLPENKQQLPTIISPDNDGDNHVVVWDYFEVEHPVTLLHGLGDLQFAYSDAPVPLTVAYVGGSSEPPTNWLLIVAAGMTLVTSVGLAFYGQRQK